MALFSKQNKEAKEGKCCLEDAPTQCDDFMWFFPSWEAWDRA